MSAETLTDEQIDQLLLDAELRLRERAAKISPAQAGSEGALEVLETSVRARKALPKLRHGLGRPTYLTENQGVAQTDPRALIDATHAPRPDGLRAIGQNTETKRINDQLNAGPDWFGLPKTDLTPELKRDLQLIEMRSVLDPHRHYKKNNRKGKVPAFSQTGTVIQGPTEFYSSRINKKDRAKNFVEEAIKTERETGRFKRKYAEVQESKTSGKKAYYKKLMAKRKKS